MRQSATPLLLVSLGLAGTAHAAGFAVDTQSARATGMAAAVTGGIDDSSAIFYNPAGIANGKDLDAQIGITPIFPSNIYEPVPGGPPPTTDAITGAVVPPTIYASTALLKPLAFGVGLYSPYGLALTWPNPWPGQYQVTHSELSTFFINPTIALGLPGLRIGVGLDIVRGTVKLNRNINTLQSPTGAVELGGGAWGAGWNIGVQADVVPESLSVGLTYRGTVSLPFTGNAHFSNIPSGVQSPFLQDQPVSATVVLPQSAQLGLTSHPSKTLTVGFDVVYTGWQSIGSLDILFEGPPGCTAPSCQNTQSLPRNWTHTFNYHLGAEWAPAEAWRVRIGGMYDPTPVPDSTLSPDLPDSSRWNIAVGGGYRIAGFTFDVGYQLVILTQTTSTYTAFPAQYHGTASLLGITIGYQTGSPSYEPPPPEPPPQTPPPPPATAPASTPPPPPAAG